MRVEYELTAIEFRALKRLLPFPGEAYAFWRGFAADRKLDYRTLLAVNGRKPGAGLRVSGLPLNHGKHWNWPHPLKCKRQIRLENTEDGS